MIEQIDVATRMARSIDLPVIIDGNAGFGDPLHTRRTITAYEDAGLAGIHLEYQVYLKRTSYHKGLEHIVPTEDFLEKIRHTPQGRGSHRPAGILPYRGEDHGTGRVGP